ncbi:fimbrillin family protein [Bacteroides rodentium]
MSFSNIFANIAFALGLFTLSGNTVTFSETDGSNDVMISGEASGNKTTGGALVFTFNHLLTQLQFTFKAGAGFPATGKTVTSITIKNQQTPASLNINDGTVSYNPTGAGITLTGSYAISADPGTTATVYPMVKSGATSVVMDIVAGGVTYPNVTVNLNTETGKAHNIILTFTPKGITVSAIVTPWVTGGTGSSIIQ